MRQNLAYTYDLPHIHPDKFLVGKASEVQSTMERTWAHPGAVTSERIVEDICRFPVAIDAVLNAKGAKVEELDNRRGRRKTRPYVPPRIVCVEELNEIKFRGLDPDAFGAQCEPPEAEAQPPQRRQRCV